MNYDLSKLGITDLNPMQQEMLQVARREQRVLLLSPTGSGKTLAYLLPVLQHLQSQTDGQLNVLVLVPSRELAIQTADVLRRLAPGVSAMACYGGRPAMEEHRVLRQMHPQILIATPGRMLDHIQKENVGTADIHTLVIDEFDKSLELGFQQQMESIIQTLPNAERRIMLSATDCPQIPHFMGNASFHRLSFVDEATACSEQVKVMKVCSPEKDKLETLYRLLCVLGTQKSLVFVNYRESVERVANYLNKKNLSVDAFHGGMEQQQRERTMFRFTNGSCAVLVSTDLAARGLDISDIENVIHYHLPLDQQAYIHRNGRTARWDKDGSAFLILGPEEYLPEYVQDGVEEFRIPQRIPSPAQPKRVTVYIGKGKKDKVSRGDVLGFLTKTGGLTGEQIGKIDVFPSWSYVAVERKVASQLLSRIRGQKIKGIKTIFALAD